MTEDAGNVQWDRMSGDRNLGPYVPVSDELLPSTLSFKMTPDPIINIPITPHLGVQISDDPLGSTDQLVRLVRRDPPDGSPTVLASKLYPVHEGTTFTLGEQGNSMWDLGLRWNEMIDPTSVRESLPHVWYVDVDGERLIEVPWHLGIPSVPSVPPVPWHRRLRRALDDRRWAILDSVLGRWGYSRGCDHDDDY